MSMLVSQVLDPGMQRPDVILGFYPVFPAFLLTGKRTLGYAKLGKRRLQISRMRYVLTVAGSENMLNTNVKTDCRKGMRYRFSVRDFAADFEIPCICLASDGKGPNLSIIGQRSMKADVYSSDMLYSEPVFGKFDAVTVGWKLTAGESIGRLEPRIYMRSFVGRGKRSRDGGEFQA